MTQQVISPEEIPQGETETALGGLLAEVIGIPSLPRTTSFFDLGLDSLSVAVACARLEQATGVRVSFSQLFRTPSVAQLAAWIDAARAQNGGGPDTPAQPSTGAGAELVAITPRQAQTVPMGLVVNNAWWFDGEIDDAALESAANDVHRRHQALRARYLPAPDLGLAELPADPGQVLFHRLPPEDSDPAALDALLRTLRQPLRLGEGEVWRCAIVRSGQGGRTLFGVAVDHAGFDGRSLTILTTELSAAYSARAAGKEPQWPGRVASLAEMAADYRRQVAGQDPDAQRRYWREELRDLPACRLPGRNDAPAEPVGPAKECAFTVPTAQLQKWEDYARANGMSASVGIAAAYVQSIIRVGGQPDFGLGVALANWSGEIIDRTITNRVGNIFLRPNGPSNSGPHLLARMRASYNQAMAARDVLVDPTEYVGITGDKSVLDGMVGMVYNSYPPLDLGGVVGSYARELRVWTGNLRDIFVEVETGPEGLGMHMIVRTDRYESSLADRLGEHFIDIISNGPEKLERETAR
ncbi:condensation domain-containing protein [Actinoplanes sp. NPDC026623]|uniref:condensation domain-containing protein n=1 Tax=Actinoplanes sp. NPDC026623 TaxID=3155610 RepID=UPI0033F8418B